MSVSEESRNFAEEIGRNAGKGGIPLTEFWQKIEDAGFTPKIATDRGPLITSSGLKRIEDKYVHKYFLQAKPDKPVRPAGERAEPVVARAEPVILKLNGGEVTVSSVRIEASFKQVRRVTVEFED